MKTLELSGGELTFLKFAVEYQMKEEKDFLSMLDLAAGMDAKMAKVARENIELWTELLTKIDRAIGD